MLLFIPLHRDLGKGRDRSIASLRSASSRFGGWGWGIASLLHFVPLHRDLGKGRDRSIASLRSASSRFGEGEGSLHCFTPFRFIAIWGLGLGNRSIASLRSASSRFGGWGWGIASLLHFVPLHRDLGKGRDHSIASLRSASSRFGEGEGLLYCFTPFCFIAIWGRGGIALLLHSVPLHRDLGKGRDRSIASLRSASSRFGEGEGLLYCFTPFCFIAIWGRGGIALLLHSVPLHRDLGKGRDRSIASLRSASSRFEEGEGVSLKPSPGNQVQLYPIWKQCAGT